MCICVKHWGNFSIDGKILLGFWGFPVGSVPKNHLPIQETWVQPLSQEDPLEKEMATHSSILAWEIPWREEPGGIQSKGLQKLDITWRLNSNNCIFSY